MRQLPKEVIASYIAALQKKLHELSFPPEDEISPGVRECIKLDLWFAKEWLDIGNAGWAWACVRNAYNYAADVGFIPRRRSQIFA